MTQDPTSSFDWSAETAEMEREWEAMQPSIHEMEQQAAAHQASAVDEPRVDASRAFQNLPVDVWAEEDQGAPIEEMEVPGMEDEMVDRGPDYFDLGRADSGGGGVDWKGIGEEVLEEAADTLAERAAKAARKRVDPPPLPGKSLPWHYAIGDETMGPVGEEEVLDLMRKGELGEESLVWNRTMKDWTPIADTPLPKKLAEDSPPPLPAKRKKAKAAKKKTARKAKARTCPSCAAKLSATDQFCSSCGAKLND